MKENEILFLEKKDVIGARKKIKSLIDKQFQIILVPKEVELDVRRGNIEQMLYCLLSTTGEIKYY